MEALRAKYPLAQLLHLLRVGRLKVPSETTSREVYALLTDAAFLQVCSACTKALNTGEKKRDADVPLFCAASSRRVIPSRALAHAVVAIRAASMASRLA